MNILSRVYLKPAPPPPDPGHMGPSLPGWLLEGCSPRASVPWGEGMGSLEWEGQERESAPSSPWLQQVRFPIYCEPSSPQRLYRSGDAESRHRYTLVPDHPDFTRARLNALHLSDVSEPAVHVWCVPVSVK